MATKKDSFLSKIKNAQEQKRILEAEIELQDELIKKLKADIKKMDNGTYKYSIWDGLLYDTFVSEKPEPETSEVKPEPVVKAKTKKSTTKTATKKKTSTATTAKKAAPKKAATKATSSKTSKKSSKKK